VFALSYEQTPSLYLLGGHFYDDLNAAVFLTAASVIGSSLIGFVGIYFVLNIAAKTVFSASGLSLILVALSVAYLLYHFSGKRMNLKLNMIVGASAAIISIVAVAKLRPSLYRPFLSHSDTKVSLVAAVNLVEEHKDSAAKKYLEDRLLSIHDRGDLEDVLDAFRSSGLILELSKDQVFRWIQSASPKNQNKILRYYLKEHDHYSWFNHEFLSSLESSIWANRKTCRGACHTLARTVAIEPSQIDWELIRAHLIGSDPEKIDFALEVIEHSKQKVLTDEIATLLEANNEDIRESALELLLDWSEENMEERARDIKDSLRGDLNSETIQKAKDFFRSRVKN
jgi:hypothetical protein